MENVAIIQNSFPFCLNVIGELCKSEDENPE